MDDLNILVSKAKILIFINIVIALIRKCSVSGQAYLIFRGVQMHVILYAESYK